MNKIKAIIVISFVLTIISAVVGVAIYYSYLSPFRAAANEGNLEDVLSEITYLEYNVTDQQGHRYKIKLTNDPETKTGVAELYNETGLEYKLYYKYSGSGLTYAKIEYSNGTVVEYSGANVVVIEDSFLTSMSFDIESENGTVKEFSPFPGVGPVYLPKFLGDRLEINWHVLASITRGTTEISPIVDVRVGMGELELMGEKVSGATLTLIPKNPATAVKWSTLSYSLFITEMEGLPVVASWSVSLTMPGQEYKLSYNLVSIEFS